MIKQSFPYILFIFISLMASSCIDFGNEDENNLDLYEILSLGENSFKILNNGLHNHNSLALPLGAMADQITMKWDNTWDFAVEPRDAYFGEYPNMESYSNYYQLIGQWKASYDAISQVNIILDWIEDENAYFLDESQRYMLEAFSYFVSGVAHGYLGLLFDQAVVNRNGENLDDKSLASWQKVCNESLLMLDKAIEIAGNYNFQIPAEWLAGNSLSNTELAELASAYAARIMISSSRTKAQNDTLDWNKVLLYCQHGITKDFTIEIGESYGWLDENLLYGIYPGWGKADYRIINIMDHSFPSRWPDDNISWNTENGREPEEAYPGDYRVVTDFEYTPSSNFPIEPGYYNSKYRYSRYDSLIMNGIEASGKKPVFMEWELKLIKAEALYRTGNTAAAISILNDPEGPRKLRGKLPDVLESDDILRCIYDEKEIECFLTAPGLSYFDMRRTDRLQASTLLHFPVPAEELALLGEDPYTIPLISDGINGSKGDWKGYDEVGLE